MSRIVHLFLGGTNVAHSTAVSCCAPLVVSWRMLCGERARKGRKEAEDRRQLRNGIGSGSPCRNLALAWYHCCIAAYEANITSTKGSGGIKFRK